MALLRFKAAEAEDARRFAQEKGEEARRKAEEAKNLEIELMNAHRQVEESQRKLADVTAMNLVTSTSSIKEVHQQHQIAVASPVISSHSQSNIINDDAEEDDDSTRENSSPLLLLFLFRLI